MVTGKCVYIKVLVNCIGNKHDNGVLEAGTDEIRQSYQEDTPGQDIEQFIKEKDKAFHEQKKQVKKNFSDVFGNPLKGYPANEEIKVRHGKVVASLELIIRFGSNIVCRAVVKRIYQQLWRVSY